jgi:tryptophan halogenase
MKKLVIIGGGTAGWISALYLSRAQSEFSITLIESNDINTIGFGEGTTPTFPGFLSGVGIDVDEFHKSIDSTIKIGIDFHNWSGDGFGYYHDFNVETPFKEPNEAYHFNHKQLKDYLKSKCINDIQHITANVIGFDRDGDDITKVKTDVGEFESDFIIDCSGIHRLVIGKEYNQKWISLSDQLKVNSVVSFSIPNKKPIEKFTQHRTGATTMKYGWLFEIPLTNETNYGYIFDGNLISREDAENEVREIYGSNIEFKRYYTFESGYYDKMWVGNSVCVGLSSGFFEPIEATSIMITIMQIQNLIKLNFKNKEEYNNKIKNIYESTFSFIRYHYVCDRDDTEFWKNYKKLPLPHMLSKLLNNNNLRRMDEEEFFNITTKDSIFLYSSYRLLSQYNFKRKKQNTLL